MSKVLKKGEVLSETQFYKVQEVKGNEVFLETDGGSAIKVSKAYAESFLTSAIHSDKVEKITRTELGEKVLSSSRVAMTVNYNKQVNPADVIKGITNLYDGLGIGVTKESFGKDVKKALNLKGEERTMVGRHYSHVDGNGRLHFIDMNETNDKSKTYDTRSRLVDPRTLNWAIIEGVTYQVK